MVPNSLRYVNARLLIITTPEVLQTHPYLKEETES
jgi:hypothetical protein